MGDSPPRNLAGARTRIEALVGGERTLIATDPAYVEAEQAGDDAGVCRSRQRKAPAREAPGPNQVWLRG